MEMKVNEVILPEQITWNYDELKSELAEKVQKYETMVYTEDQVKDAKADVASLRKLKKALNDERIRREKEYMKPFNVFEDQVNEIIGIIDKPVQLIDTQLKDYEEERKAKKKADIEAYWEQTEHPSWVTMTKIFEEVWLNASYSESKIKKEIDTKIDIINTDADTISRLPEFNFEAMEVYKESLDLNKAIQEGQRLSEIQKRKAEAEERARAEEERRKAEAEAKEKELMAKVAEEEAEAIMADMEAESQPEEKTEVRRMTVRFEAELTVEEAMELKEFFQERGITFRAIN